MLPDEDEIVYPYLDGKKLFCRAVVNLSFNRAVKLYESYGNRYVLNSYSVADADMEDHVCIRSVNGKPTLIAIEVFYKDKDGYAPVEEPISDMLIGKYFEYDAETRSYKRSDKVIPTAFSCQEIREYLYTYGFDIDGVHYVRYKRSAGASRDGRCLFIAESIIADAEQRSGGCFVITAENVRCEPAVIREFCRARGVHLYTECDAVVYANESYLYVHAAGNELPEIKLPEGKTIPPAFKCDATKPMHPLYISELYEMN